MQIRRLDEHTIALEDIDPLCAALLTNIVVRANPSGDAAAEARIFSTPTHGAEPETDADWKEYVEPDLRRLFQDAVDVVKSDLAGFPPEESEPPYELRLPIANLEPWIHALNQARLTLAARFSFTESDMDQRMTLDTDPRSRALFEVRFYGLLQEFLLHQLDEDSD
jgi:hypothetical protein